MTSSPTPGPVTSDQPLVDDSVLLWLRAAEDAVRAASDGDATAASGVLAGLGTAADALMTAGQISADVVEGLRADARDALAARGVGGLDLGPWWAAAPGAPVASAAAGRPPSPEADWWWAMPSVRVDMPCGTEGHVGVWEQGVLRVDGLDRESEDVLAALGGATCRCAETEAAWEAGFGDLAILTVAARSDTDPCRVDLRALTEAEAPRLASIRAWERHRERSGTPDPDEPTLTAWRARVRRLLLLTLPVDLQRRLVAGVASTAADRWAQQSPQHRARLTAATGARIVVSLRETLRSAGQWRAGDPDPLVALTLAPSPAPEVSAEHVGGRLRLRLTLDPAWLSSVWGRGLEQRGGDLCLAVTKVTPSAVEAGVSLRFPPASGNSRVEHEVVQWETEGSPSGESPTQE